MNPRSTYRKQTVLKSQLRMHGRVTCVRARIVVGTANYSTIISPRRTQFGICMHGPLLHAAFGYLAKERNSHWNVPRGTPSPHRPD
jgi:hypothetical protein